MCCEKFLEKLKQFTLVEMSIMKLCLFAFALMLAKLWPVILSLSWGWYAVVFAVTYAYLVYSLFIKK